MSLEPYVWGPHYWNTLHFIAATYDNSPNQSVKSSMKTFIQSFPVLLPCKECQDNAFNFLKSVNIDKVVESRQELFTFFFNFHNMVNKRLKKPLMKMEEALIRYHVPKEDPLYVRSPSDTKEKTVGNHTGSSRLILVLGAFVIIITILIHYTRTHI